MRAFLALSLPPSVQETLAALQIPLRRTPCRVSWVRKGNFHCTIRFLGEIDNNPLDTIHAALRDALPTLSALRLRLGNTGAFPNTRRPAVLWVGVQSLQGDLNALHAVCEAAARCAGLPPDTKAFHPHITLGRVRDAQDPAALASALNTVEVPETDAFPLAAVSLYQSILKPSGPEYRLLEEFPLACPPSPRT